MDNSLIIEVYIAWVQLLSQNDKHSMTILTNLTSQSKSLANILVVLYIVLSFTIKKGRYIAAFILCEVIADTYVYSSIGGWEIFFINAIIYSVLYWSCRDNLKLSMACATMVIFETVMVLDAKFYNDVKTVIYVNYEYIVTFIHLCIISSLLPWQRIKRGLGDIARAIYGMFSNSNSVAYIGYSYNTFKQKGGKCQIVTIA